jgi:predicted phage gp36 major capsid-like protein
MLSPDEIDELRAAAREAIDRARRTRSRVQSQRKRRLNEEIVRRAERAHAAASIRTLHARPEDGSAPSRRPPGTRADGPGRLHRGDSSAA